MEYKIENFKHNSIEIVHFYVVKLSLANFSTSEWGTHCCQALCRSLVHVYLMSALSWFVPPTNWTRINGRVLSNGLWNCCFSTPKDAAAGDRLQKWCSNCNVCRFITKPIQTHVHTQRDTATADTLVLYTHTRGITNRMMEAVTSNS